MEYTIDFDISRGICAVRVTGIHKCPQDSLVLQQLSREYADKYGCQKFLFDMSRADIIAGTFDTYETGTVPVDSDRKQLQQRIALVYAGDLSEHKFLETIAVNRGYHIRVFDTEDMAIEWLQLKRATPNHAFEATV